MKKFLLLIPLLGFGLITWACPACEKQQPAILRGITHGAGPTGNWDYVIVAVTVVITLATLFYAVKWMINPGEKELNHIKRTILN
jgi:phage shock protein PspC (stress-responsive transcriptional regulator)